MLRIDLKYRIVQLVIGFLLVTNFTFCQYVNQLNLSDTIHEYAVNYNHDRQNLVGITTYRDLSWGNWNRVGLMFSEYDQNYNKINITTHIDPNWSQFCSRGGMTFDGEAYYIAGAKRKYPSPDTAFAYILKYDSLGNVLWEKNFDMNAENGQVIACRYKQDSIYALIGINAAVTGELKTYLVSMDTSGAVGWTSNYFPDWEASITFQLTSDNGFIYSTFSDEASYVPTHVYKLDSLGNIEWQTDLFYSTNQHVLTFHEMPGGNFLGYGYSEDPTSSSNKRSWLVELDWNGAILKDTILDYSTGLDLFGHYSSPIFYNNGFQLVGSFYDDANSDTNKTFIARYDYDFNLLWRRGYHVRGVDDSFFFQHDLGNGFTEFAGHCVQDDPSNTHDEWFLVLDSVGCNYPNCNLGLETLNEESGIIAYPNPTTENVWISGLNISDGPFHFVLNDLQGKVVLDEVVNDTKYLVELPYTGMYVLKVLNDDGIVDVVKVVRN